MCSDLVSDLIKFSRLYGTMGQLVRNAFWVILNTFVNGQKVGQGQGHPRVKVNEKSGFAHTGVGFSSDFATLWDF